jgi:predicted RNA methylase
MDRLTIKDLKDIIRKYNKDSKKKLTGWSTLKKAELIKFINKNKLKYQSEEEEAKEQKKDIIKMEKKLFGESKTEQKQAKKKPIPKKKETSEPLKIQIIPPKQGDKYFDPNFSKKSKIEQLQIVLKTSKITGKAPDKEFYENIAGSFFDNANKLMNMSPYKALREFVNKYQLTPKMLELIYQSKTDGDFFPTGKSCIDKMIDKMSRYLKLDGGEFKMLEGTSGIGQVGYYFKQKYPNSNITLNELSPNNLAISKLFLNNNDYTFSNKDFFDITDKNYDVIFLNPPFGSKDHFYIKFLLHALKLLNQNAGNKMVFFISPALGWSHPMFKTDESMGNQYSNIFDIIYPSSSKSTQRIPLKALIKWINELNNSKFTEKDFKAVYEVLHEGSNKKLPEKQEELKYIIDNHYNFILGEEIGRCTDFGGTKLNASMYYFQVLRQGTGAGKPMKIVKTGSGYKCCCK